MSARFIGVTGLPRSGSTLLCQLLAEHPEIGCEGHSSPLCNLILALRRLVSDDQFFLSQLDVQFEQSYANLKSAMQGFLRGWHEQNGRPVVVDKNRAWLHCIELLLELAPEAKLVVTVRELGQIYGSIEAQHQKTLLVDFIDHLADYDCFGRADQLFAKDKAVGAPLISLRAMADLPPKVKERIYLLKFEDLMAAPGPTMDRLYAWLGVAPHTHDFGRLTVRPHESDSHYRMKYRHRQHDHLAAPARHEVPPRIQRQIESACAWFYEWFYPEQIAAGKKPPAPAKPARR